MDDKKRATLVNKYADELINLMKIRMVGKEDIAYVIGSAMLEYYSEMLKELKLF